MAHQDMDWKIELRTLKSESGLQIYFFAIGHSNYLRMEHESTQHIDVYDLDHGLQNYHNYF